MSKLNLEERLIILENNNSKIEKLEHEIARLQAVNEIQNLMGTYEYLHTACKHKEVMELYAKKAPRVRVYLGDLGYWEGPDAPQRAWAVLDRISDNTGHMAIHPTTTPVIEVAKDGKTAKAMWIGTGLVAMGGANKIPTATWEWDKYGVDFVREDGRWKFWHFHIYNMFRAGWDNDWAHQFEKKASGHGGISVADDIRPDGPPVDDYPYSPSTLQQYIPKPPVPYETWDDTMMY